MSITKINNKIITLGLKLFASIKYEIDSKYSVFEFLKLDLEKRTALEAKFRKFLNKQ